MKRTITNNYLVVLTLLFATVIIYVSFFIKKPIVVSNLQTIATQIVEFCANSRSRQSCYDLEIPKLMGQGISMQQSFDVIKLIQNQDGGYWFCHAVAHKLSTNEYNKNPSNWRNVMTECSVGMCSNGCLHGAMQAHFSSESLNGVQLAEVMPDLQTICEQRSNWQPTQQQQSSCYHELGHLSLYLTNSDVVRAGDICNTVSVKTDGRNFLQTCNEGIFMQVFEPREPDDFALIYDIVPEKEKLTICDKYSTGVEKGGCWKIGWVEKYKDFCNGFSGDLRFACFREAWVINSDTIQTGPAVLDYCSYTTDLSENRKCYNKLFYALMSIFHMDHELMKPICNALPQNIKAQCLANTASRLIETDKRLIDQSVEVCNYAFNLGVGEDCYAELTHYAQFVFSTESPEFNKICKAMPEKWSKKCLDQKI